MCCDWTIRDDEMLISFVRIHESLYNTKSKDYRKPQLKHKLWCDIGRILNKTDSNCSKRWCYVRDYYIRRKGKPGIGSSREAAKKRSDLLCFLDNLPSSQRLSITNVDEDENAVDNEDSCEGTSAQNHNTEDMICDSNNVYNEEDGHIDKSVNSKVDSHNNHNEEGSEGDERLTSDKERNHILHAQERLSLLKQIVQRNLCTQIKLDENDLFFNSMAKIVKKLPRYDQAQLRMQIGSLVGNAELSYISNNSPQITESPSDDVE